MDLNVVHTESSKAASPSETRRKKMPLKSPSRERLASLEKEVLKSKVKIIKL